METWGCWWLCFGGDLRVGVGIAGSTLMKCYAESKHGVGFALVTHVTWQIDVVCAGVRRLQNHCQSHKQDHKQEHIAKDYGRRGDLPPLVKWSSLTIVSPPSYEWCRISVTAAVRCWRRIVSLAARRADFIWHCDCGLGLL